MKLNMDHIIKGIIGLGICSVIMLLSTDPAQAVLEGNCRDRLEFLDFSESLIKHGLYAKTGRETFNTTKKKYVRGLKRHNEPKIYEPDVYTWELAMAEHRKKMNALKAADVASSNVTPIPMLQDSLLPSNPKSNVLKKDRKGKRKSRKSRKDKNNEAMNETLTPAIPIAQGYPKSEQEASQVTSIYSAPAPTDLSVPALQPAVIPQGKSGDSCDASF